MPGLQVVKIQNFPMTLPIENIVHFLDYKVDPENTHVVKDPMGIALHSGLAFCDVNFVNLHKVIEKHMGRYEGQTVSVTITTKADVEQYISMLESGKPMKGPEGDKTQWARVRGFAYNVEVDTVANVFVPYGIQENEIVFDVFSHSEKQGDFNGQVFVHFKDSLSRGRFVEQRHRSKIDGTDRVLECFECNDADWLMLQMRMKEGAPLLSARRAAEKRALEGTDDGPPPYVKCRGIPYLCYEDEILQFFGDSFDLKHDQIMIMFEPNGRPMGECMVRLKSWAECRRAQGLLHKKTLGGRYIDVFVGDKGCIHNFAGENRGLGMEGKRKTPKHMLPPPSEAVTGGPSASHNKDGTVRSETSEHARRPPMGSMDAFRMKDDHGYLRMTGAPLTSTRQDVVDFFGPIYDLGQNDVVQEERGGNFTGTVFVRMEKRLVPEALGSTMKGIPLLGSRVHMAKCDPMDAHQAGRDTDVRGAAKKRVAGSLAAGTENEDQDQEYQQRKRARWNDSDIKHTKY